MFYELLTLGLVCFIAPWLARLGGYEIGRKPFDLVGLGGIFFLLTAAFGLMTPILPLLGMFTQVLTMISFLLGVIALVIGVLWETIEVLIEPGRGMLHKAS